MYMLRKIYQHFFFFSRSKVAKYFIDVVQDSPRTDLCIYVETKSPSLEPSLRY